MLPRPLKALTMSTLRNVVSATLLTGLLSASTFTSVQAAPGAAHQGARVQRAALLATRMAEHPALAAIADLLALERLYRTEHKPDAIRQLYTEVLGRTADPVVQNFAQRRLARLEFRQGNPKAAEELLKENLARNLARGGAAR
jgi:hypothetical protein